MNRLILILCLASLACGVQTQIPVTPTLAHDTQLIIRFYPRPLSAPTPSLVRVVCLTAETVNLRDGAGTGYKSISILSAGDPLTLTGEIVTAPDGGAWLPVDTDKGTGFINARYVCFAAYIAPGTFRPQNGN